MAPQDMSVCQGTTAPKVPIRVLNVLKAHSVMRMAWRMSLNARHVHLDSTVKQKVRVQH